MHRMYKPLPRLIVRAVWPLMSIFSVITVLGISDGNILRPLREYSLIAILLLLLALVTVVEKPTEALTVFVVICDLLILAGLIMYLRVDNTGWFLFILFPVMVLLIVLSRPNTAHYMMDKYDESLRQAEKENRV